MRISVLKTTSSKEFSRLTDESTFGSRYEHDISSTTVYLLRPPGSHPSSSSPAWIVTTSGSVEKPLLHPLTRKQQFWNLPRNFDLAQYSSSTLAVAHDAFCRFDKLLVVPKTSKFNIQDCSLLALYDGGKLRGCPPYSQSQDKVGSPWIKISRGTIDKFDDVISHKGKVYALDRQGKLYVVSNTHTSTRKINLGKTVVNRSVTPGSGRFGWRKRMVVGLDEIYLVVRTDEKVFIVYRLIKRGKSFDWGKVNKLEGQVLFMARDYCFFIPAAKFPGRQFKNCIVFSEAAFPQYGKDGWEFTQFPRHVGFVRKREEDIAIYGLDSGSFFRENEGCPKISWSPPSWIFAASSVSAAESQSRTQSGRESVEDAGLESDSNSQDEKNEEMQPSSSSRDEEDEEMDSDSQDEDDKEMQSELNSQDKEEDMHSDPNIEDGASMQEDVSPSSFGAELEDQTADTVTTSLSAAEEEVTRTLLTMNSVNGAAEEETSRKKLVQSLPRACTTSATKADKSASATVKFEGFDVRSDLVQTLQRIWQKHGNITENSIMRSGDMIARALESLATMVLTLEGNSAQSLSDCQADFLSSTLSDLRCMCFKVNWLIPFVEKAVRLHKSKPLVDSLNNLNQLSSQVKERRSILRDELAKLCDEESKLKEEMAKVSKMIPFSGEVNFDEPLGKGLT